MSISKKKEIMELEDYLPTISESYPKLSRIGKYHLELIYHQPMKFLKGIAFRPNRILDAACGDAFVLNWFDSDALQKIDYVGVDVSRRKIRRAKELHKNEKTEFIVADVDRLPFRPESFGRMLMLEAIEHVPRPNSTIKELERVLCRQGKLILTTPSAYGVKGSRTEILRRLINPTRRHVPSNREKAIEVCGMTLPHRDFSEEEIVSLLCSHFRLRILRTFQFAILYCALTGITSLDWFLVKMARAIERLQTIMPRIWGSKFLAVCEKS